MGRASIVTLVVGLAMLSAGCAAARGPRTPGEEPAAAIAPGVGALAGRWHGSIWETGASLYQGVTALDLAVGDDGRWRGTIGSAEAQGRARVDERGWLVLEGTARDAQGRGQPVHMALTGDAEHRWGGVLATFAGRPANAVASLRHVSEVSPGQPAPAASGR
jgi:hypothetical protein